MDKIKNKLNVCEIEDFGPLQDEKKEGYPKKNIVQKTQARTQNMFWCVLRHLILKVD